MMWQQQQIRTKLINVDVLGTIDVIRHPQLIVYLVCLPCVLKMQEMEIVRNGKCKESGSFLPGAVCAGYGKCMEWKCKKSLA